VRARYGAGVKVPDGRSRVRPVLIGLALLVVLLLIVVIAPRVGPMP
jgi:hypothetical protein